MIKKTLISLAATTVLAAAPALSFAEDAAPAASPLSFNVGLVTDYRYRGISQSRLQPALQGGADYAFSSGSYVGTWLSTIKWIKDTPTAGSTPAEWDIYGGHKGELAKDLAYDVGGLYYAYVNNKYSNVGANADTFEIYGALTYGPVTGKYSHSVTNLFGNVDSKNSGYFEVAATFDLGNGWGVTPHVGYQDVKGPASSDATYTDYSLTVAKDFGNGLTGTLAVVGTDAKESFYTLANKFNGKNGVVAGVKYSF